MTTPNNISFYININVRKQKIKSMGDYVTFAEQQPLWPQVSIERLKRSITVVQTEMGHEATKSFWSYQIK